MSQDLSQGTFNVIWEDLLSYNIMNNQNSPTAVAEMTSTEFLQEQGFDINLLFNEMPEEYSESLSLDMPTTTPIDTDNDDPINNFPIINPVELAPAQTIPQPMAITPDLTTSTSTAGPMVTHPTEFTDISSEDVRKLISHEENKNTLKKTLSDVAKFERFLLSKSESRKMHEIESDSFDEYLANFILSVRKPSGDQYEPSTIRNMVSSIDRKLRRHQYPYKIFTDQSNVFQLSRDALHAKQKSLKRLGKVKIY